MVIPLFMPSQNTHKLGSLETTIKAITFKIAFFEKYQFANSVTLIMSRHEKHQDGDDSRQDVAVSS